MSTFNIINGLIYTFGWLFCVISGAYHSTLLPLIVTFFLVLQQLIFLCKKNRTLFTQDMFILLYGIFFGFLMELLFINAGWIHYATENFISNKLPPGWVFSLYFLFSLTYNHSLYYLNKYHIFPFIFGLIGGPLSYYAGSRLGAVFFSHQIVFLYLGICWGFYLTLMIVINRKLAKIVQKAYDKKALEQPLTVFFDVVCPICSKELIHLKKRKQTGKVLYFEVSSPEKFAEEMKMIDFQTVMKEIHGIEASGRVLKGIDVFFALYSRTNHQFLAVLLKAPLLQPLFKFTYRIWAKYRLKNRCKIKTTL